MADAILVLNAGSSSLKFALFETGSAAAGDDPELMLRGQIEGIGRAPEFLIEPGGSLEAGAAPESARMAALGGHAGALGQLLAWLKRETAGVTLAASASRRRRGSRPRFSTI